MPMQIWLRAGACSRFFRGKVGATIVVPAMALLQTTQLMRSKEEVGRHVEHSRESRGTIQGDQIEIRSVILIDVIGPKKTNREGMKGDKISTVDRR